MAYSEKLAAKIRVALAHLQQVEEKKMMSGIVFLVNGKMCVNATKDGLMVRIDPGLSEKLIAEKDCEPVQMKGRAIKGYVVVNEDFLNANDDFNYWINLALSFNDKAKASKKRKKPS